MIKLSKIIILPIWVKVLTKKEYIQEMVKEEIKKQWVQNNNNVQNQIPAEQNLTVEENNQPFTHSDNILVSNNIDNIVKKNGIIWVIIFSILFLLWLISVYVNSKYIVLLTLVFIFSTFSFWIYLIIKLDILDFIIKKVNINNIGFTNIIQKINPNFILLILLSITLFLWYLNVIITVPRHTWFFKIFIISNLIQIHFIILFVLTFIKLWKLEWVTKEFNKLKQFDFFNNSSEFLRDKINLVKEKIITSKNEFKNNSEDWNDTWIQEISKSNFTTAEISIMVIILIVIIVWISKMI